MTEKLPSLVIVGRPNVGKSTLFNRLTGTRRSIVTNEPGITRDRIYGKAEWRGRALEVVDTGGIVPDDKALIPQEILRQAHVAIKKAALLVVFVDTAGIRRKGKTTLVAEKLSVVMARRGLERCDVALLVVDGEQGVTQGDAQIASYAEESGRSVVIVINKWDLAVVAARDAASRDAATAKGKSKRAPGERHKPENFDSGRLMFDYEKMIRAKLKFLSYAPIVFLSAKSGERAERLYPLINQCWEARRRRIATPALNNWLKEEVDLQRGTTPKARPVRIYYITQAKIAPPTFLIFTNQKALLHFSYQRFLENQLRAKYDFVGTPVRFIQRLRKRDRNTSGSDE